VAISHPFWFPGAFGDKRVKGVLLLLGQAFGSQRRFFSGRIFSRMGLRSGFGATLSALSAIVDTLVHGN
jgi:hypothetical protein